jgi:hypothetical protein
LVLFLLLPVHWPLVAGKPVPVATLSSVIKICLHYQILSLSYKGYGCFIKHVF